MYSRMQLICSRGLPHGFVLLDLLGQPSAVLHQQRSALFLPQRLITAERMAGRHQFLLVSFRRGSCSKWIQMPFRTFNLNVLE